MVQPFMNNIIDEGEYSLFYFGGEYSHAILKLPAPGDFRVQEEHGGDIQPVEPSIELRVVGEKTVRLLDEVPLYARVDFVRDADDQFLLMEMELIEPALYFRMDKDSPERFAQAVNSHIVVNCILPK